MKRAFQSVRHTQNSLETRYSLSVSRCHCSLVLFLLASIVPQFIYTLADQNLLLINYLITFFLGEYRRFCVYSICRNKIVHLLFLCVIARTRFTFFSSFLSRLFFFHSLVRCSCCVFETRQASK